MKPTTNPNLNEALVKKWKEGWVKHLSKIEDECSECCKMVSPETDEVTGFYSEKTNCNETYLCDYGVICSDCMERLAKPFLQNRLKNANKASALTN